MSTIIPSPSIKTDIFEFCQSFAGILKPFSESLASARSSLREKAESGTLQQPLAVFSDIQHRLESLSVKVAEQQAYVIIFGPLKSGKSTLMNALSAAYVSEVTSLPAYPCLVQLKHGDENSFVATRYSGEKLEFPDNASLQALIQNSHQTLAARLREVEELGETFDPGVHLPDAIRRVDVVAPTRNLKDSLTVLVDTPGLYTRMKFGYDLMTREFRNSAACAVFVVKTDNLFLEQVFEEFNQLLDLFSRIFLVVNIDTNKRDLDASGGLHPSLESRSPGEVIRAFESLVMSAPLRRAQDEGRLRIYPIDLLSSASAAMKEWSEAPPESPAVPNEPAAIEIDGPETPPSQTILSIPPLPTAPASPLAAEQPAAEQPAAADEQQVLPVNWADHPEASFSLFLKDLTEYLNSSEYLQEFMGDALLMGANLGIEAREQCAPAATGKLETDLVALQKTLVETESRLAAVEKLESINVQASLAPMREEASRYAGEVSKAAAAEALKKSKENLDAWFFSDDSVSSLQEKWSSSIDACAKRVGTECLRKLHALAASPLGGIQVDSELRSSVDGLDQLLGPVVESARATLAAAEPSFQISAFAINPEQLKVRKSIWDWLAFRSVATVRRKTFGEPAEMTLAVPAPIKEKRLGDTGRQALEDLITTAISDRFPGEAASLSEGLLADYSEALNRELRGKLQAGREEYTTKIAALTERISANQAIRSLLRNLASEADGLIDAVEQLRGKYRTSTLVETAAILTPEPESEPESEPEMELESELESEPQSEPPAEPKEVEQAADAPTPDDAPEEITDFAIPEKR